MTRVHLKLLGPCFKTGQMGDRLYTESSVRGQSTSDRTNGPTTDTCVVRRPTAQQPPTANSPTPTTSQLHPLSQAHRILRSAKTRVLYALVQQRNRPTRRTPYANAPDEHNENAARQPCGMPKRRSLRRRTEYAPDTSAPSASIMSVSRSLALSFQSAFQLSFTVLVCYRSRGRI